MSFMEQLAQPYNLFFTVAIGLSTFFLLVQVLGFGLDELFNIDVAADGGDLDLDLDLDAGMDVDADVDIDAGGSFSFLAATLLFFHGRTLPAILIVYMLFGAFGFGGLALTAAAQEFLGWSGNLLYACVPAALLLAVIVTKAITWPLSRVLPGPTVTHDNRRLVGQTARAIQGGVDHRVGKALAKNADGHDLIVTCTMAPGEPPVPTDGEVKLTRWDPERRLFVCQSLAKAPAAPAQA